MSVLREILESIAEYFEADEENMKDYKGNSGVNKKNMIEKKRMI